MRYLFEDCALDMNRRELRRGPMLLAIEPQVFDLLAHLIRHRDRVVSKDDLLETIWQGRVVSESALFNRINAARKAIGDTGERQRLIKTLPRKGLRFVGEVREETMEALPLPDRPSIAVLPFTDMSGDPGKEYFADGISEDLVTGLARIRWLFVIARNSAFVYKHRAVDVKQVSRELGVRYVLEGSVRRAGKRLRITAQLVDATTGGHLWAECYDRELGDIFALQDEITRSVAAAIEPRLLVAEGSRVLARSPEHLGAWDLVAQAHAHFWRLTRADYEAAVKPLQQAVELLSQLCAGARPARLLPGVRRAYGMDRQRPGDAARPRACDTGDRARRLRSLGSHRARLLGDDGTPYGGFDCGVSSSRPSQS